jgi:glycosyltransferase involved in cell wall biosynthesis
MKNNKPRIRVVLIGNYPVDNSIIHGGVQAAFAYLVSGLGKIDDLELHVITVGRPDWTGPKLINQNRVMVHLLPSFPRFERLRNYRTYQSILNQELFQIQPDVVHAQEAAADAKVALRSSFPTVVTAHGIRYEDSKYFHSWSQQIRLYFDSILLERYVLHRLRHLIAISHYVTDYFADLLRPDLQKYFIPNAIDERFFSLADVSNTPVVLFAGSVIPRKRVTDLIQAFARVIQQLPTARLRIAGECYSDPEYVDAVRREINRAGLEKQVQLLGLLSESMILSEFANCNFLVLPSSQETTPMVVAQAMAAGKPVVATQVGGVAEMVGKNSECGILVPVGDIAGLSQAILYLLQDMGLRERMGQSGRKFARQNYFPDEVAGRTAEVYREIVAREGCLHG